MEQTKKETIKIEDKQTIIHRVEGIICRGCTLKKLILLSITYFKDGQVILILFCDSCGSLCHYNLYDDKEKEEDVRNLSLKNMEKKNKLKIKKQEKTK